MCGAVPAGEAQHEAQMAVVRAMETRSRQAECVVVAVGEVGEETAVEATTRASGQRRASPPRR